MNLEQNPMDSVLDEAVNQIHEETIDDALVEAAAARVWARLSAEMHPPLHIYQIAVALIAVFMIAQGIVRFAKGQANQTLLKFFVRLIVWGGMALVAISPDFTYWLAGAIGIETSSTDCTALASA